MAKRPSTAAAWTALALLLLVTAWSAWQIQPPAPLTSDADSTRFSAQRAEVHLEAMGTQPRIPGNAYHAAARAYIVDYLTNLGLEVDVQWSTIVLPDRRQVPFRAGRVANVAARLPGRDSSGAVLLAAHYDSVRSGPGVGDDLVGVAALLETARALSSGEPLPNDIIFLITDAHEYGLLGAHVFANEHRWMQDVRLMFNFEGQGPTGPVFMFESTEPNAQWIRDWARAVPYPRGDSVSLSLYEQLNFDNDFRVFKEAGLPGLGFAALADMAYYHSELDNLERLNLRTLQHQGSNALGLAAYHGFTDFSEEAVGGSAVYFNVGRWLLHYPADWARPLVLLAAFTALLVVIAGVGQGQIHLASLAWALLATGLALVVSVLAVWAASQWLELTASTYRGYFFYTSFLVQILVFWWWAAGALRRLETRYLLGAAALWTALGGLALGLLLPLGSHLLTWPSLLASLSFFVVLGIGRSGGEALHRTVAVLIVLPAVLLLAPLIWLLFTVMTPGFPVPGAALAGVCLLLLMPLLQMWAVRFGARWSLPVLFVGLLLLALPAVLGYDADHPQRYDLFYVQELQVERTYWALRPPADHPWLDAFVPQDAESEVLRNVLPFYGRYLVSDADSLAIAPFTMATAETTNEAGERRLAITLTSARQAHSFLIYVDPGTHILGSSLNGEMVTGEFQADWIWALQCLGVGDQPLTLEIVVPAEQELVLTIVEQSHDAPQLNRPPELIRSNQWPYTSGSIFVSQTIRFDEKENDDAL